MRKLEEEQFKTKQEWVKFHKFPEDTLADWYKNKAISKTEVNTTSRANFKVNHKETFMNCRCKICNYSNKGLHEKALIQKTGFKVKGYRAFFFDDKKDTLCEYCYFPMKQYTSANEKTKFYMTDLGLHEIENAKLEYATRQLNKEILIDQ